MFLGGLFFVWDEAYVWVYLADASKVFAFRFFCCFVVVGGYFVYVVVVVFVFYFGVFWFVLFDVLGYHGFSMCGFFDVYRTIPNFFNVVVWFFGVIFCV